ncbi:MAG: rhodanese-like domain-containing protein, partial [Pseudolysinimonas sp.]
MATRILITADELTGTAVGEVLPGGGPLRILDVRWRLDQPDGRPDFLAGHIPGAQYVDLDTQLARHGEPRDGRHPIPPVRQLQQDARGWGIDPGDTVVVYDNLKSLSAARAWWLLRDAGIADVRLLDGQPWCEPGHPWNGTACGGYNTNKKPEKSPDEIAAEPVVKTRTPQHDADCQSHYKGKPSA